MGAFRLENSLQDAKAENKYATDDKNTVLLDIMRIYKLDVKITN